MNDATSERALKSLCEEMYNLQRRKDTLEEELTEINKQLDTLRMRKIPDAMASLDLKTVTYDGIGRVQLATDVFASTRPGQKEAAIEWLRDCGYAEMVQESVNASSLKALFRRLLKDGAEVPDEIFNVTPFIRASIVKA